MALNTTRGVMKGEVGWLVSTVKSPTNEQKERKTRDRKKEITKSRSPGGGGDDSVKDTLHQTGALGKPKLNGKAAMITAVPSCMRPDSTSPTCTTTTYGLRPRPHPRSPGPRNQIKK